MSIFSKLFGNKEIDNVLTNIDNISQKYFKNSIDSQTYDTLSKNAINDAIKTYSDKEKSSKNSENNKSNNQIESVLSELQAPTERINRYEVYDHLYKSVQLIKRIITVYTNNIFQKDTINNEILIISDKESLSVTSESKLMKFYTKQIIKYYDLDKKIKYHTGFNVLKYGDAFIEVIDYTTVNLPFPKINKEDLKSEQKLLQEVASIGNASKNEYKKTNNNVNVFLNQMVSVVCEFDNHMIKPLTETENSDLDLDDLLLEYASDNINDNFFNRDRVKSIVLRFHKPHKIIPLISPFESILGYVELTSIDRASSSNNTNYFKEIVQKFNDCGSDSKIKSNREIIDKFSKEIVKTILIKNNIASKENQSMNDYVDSIQGSLGDELFNSLKFLLLTPESLFKSKLKVRFIKSENMFWFKTPSSDFYPFGRSIIDPLVFPGKMYLFNQLANNITKLSKASTIRKWTVNISAVLKFC